MHNACGNKGVHLSLPFDEHIGSVNAHDTMVSREGKALVLHMWLEDSIDSVMLIKIMSLINKNMLIVFFVCVCDNQGVHLPHFVNEANDENSDEKAGDDAYNK